MAVTGWLEIEYPVTDPVISGGRIGTDQTVILHARTVQRGLESQSHETRAGVLTESIHLVTLDVISIGVPRILPGQGLDDDGQSRSENVQELLRSLVKKEVVTLRPFGESYLMRLPRPLQAKLDGNAATLVPDDFYHRFSLSLNFRQHGYGSSDF